MGVFCRAYISHCDWHLGYPVRSLKIAEEGLALAREISHPFSIALALNYLAMLHQFRREPDAALKVAMEARNICAEYRFDYYGAWSSLVRAWAIAESGGSTKVWPPTMRRLRSSDGPARDFGFRIISACLPRSIVRPDRVRGRTSAH